jgi:hypothetical protein
LRGAIEGNDRYVFTTAGDSFAAALGQASDAVRAATESQLALTNASWSGPELNVRMGLHLGEAEERGGDYFGPAVNTAARVEAAGHGGHVVITDAVRTAAGVTDATDLGVRSSSPRPSRAWRYRKRNDLHPTACDTSSRRSLPRRVRRCHAAVCGARPPSRRPRHRQATRSRCGQGRQPATIAYGRHLARQLGILDDYTSRIDEQVSQPDEPTGATRSMIALRAELTCRGWD